MRSQCTPPPPFPQADPAAPPDLVTSIWVAGVCGVTRHTIMAWVREGLMPRPVRVGKKYLRFKRAAIMTWLEERGIISHAS